MTAQPAIRSGAVCENPITGEHVVILEAPCDNGGERILALLTVRPGGAVAGEHVHPHTRERFGVLDGELGVRRDGTGSVGRAGDEFVISTGTRHDWWNAGAGPAQVLVEVSPPGRFSDMILTLFALARDGLTDAAGRPRLLQAVLLGHEFEAEIRFVSPPRWVQRPLFALLAPVARLRGHQATHAHGPLASVGADELDRLRDRAADAFPWAGRPIRVMA